MKGKDHGESSVGLSKQWVRKTMMKKGRKIQKVCTKNQWEYGRPLIKHLQHSDKEQESQRKRACNTHSDYLGATCKIGLLCEHLDTLMKTRSTHTHRHTLFYISPIIGYISYHFYYEFRLSPQWHPYTKTSVNVFNDEQVPPLSETFHKLKWHELKKQLPLIYMESCFQHSHKISSPRFFWYLSTHLANGRTQINWDKAQMQSCGGLRLRCGG